MDIQHVPPALQEKLGADATLGLVAVIDSAGREWKQGVMTMATDRFERRLIEETSGLRVQMAQMEGRLKDKMSDLLKWSFVFWIGHVATTIAIVSVMLRVR